MGGLWILGGDCNAITGRQQPTLGNYNVLDFFSTDVVAPQRTSMDKRPTSGHGKRLLDALAGHGCIVHGLVCKSCDPGFTRMPTRNAGCPGVIDYVAIHPSLLQFVGEHGFRILNVGADLSDHNSTSLCMEFLEFHDHAQEVASKF